MKLKVIAGSMMGLGLLGVGILAGSVVGPNQAAAQTAPAAATATPAPSAPANPAQPAPANPAQPANPAPAAPSQAAPSTIQAAITQQQAEQAALAANPGATVAHTRLDNENGVAAYDVDFANGGGAIVNAQTGAVISSEAAGADKGGRGGGGADQAALAAQAKITQQQAEQAALAANAGSTVDHSRLGQENGTIFWDVDFTNGGGAKIDATTGAVITSEAAGTDQGGHHGGSKDGPDSAPSTAPQG